MIKRFFGVVFALFFLLQALQAQRVQFARRVPQAQQVQSARPDPPALPARQFPDLTHMAVWQTSLRRRSSCPPARKLSYRWQLRCPRWM